MSKSTRALTSASAAPWYTTVTSTLDACWLRRAGECSDLDEKRFLNFRKLLFPLHPRPPTSIRFRLTPIRMSHFDSPRLDILESVGGTLPLDAL